MKDAKMSETEPVDDQVTYEEFNRAEENWYEGHYGLRCEEAETRFFTYCHSLEQSFVDNVLGGDGDDGVYKVAASTAQRIRLLASPNFKTIIEAYYKRHPWK